MLDNRVETFLALCEIMNYTKTAETLHITQPAVTQQIRWLEEYYGCRLFSYQGKVLRLTEKRGNPAAPCSADDSQCPGNSARDGTGREHGNPFADWCHKNHWRLYASAHYGGFFTGTSAVSPAFDRG